MTFYLGPKIGDGLTPETAFRAPGVYSAMTNVTDAICAFEAASDPGAGYVTLGDGPLDLVASARRTAIGNALGITLVAQRVGPILHEILAKKRPGMPERGRRFRIKLGSIDISDVPAETDFRWLAALPLFRAEYGRIRNLVLDGKLPPGTHRRLLDKWQWEHSIADYRVFLNGLPDEGTLPRQTSDSDPLNQADSDTPGDGGWTERASTDFDQSGNRCLCVTANSYQTMCHRNSWAGGANYYVQAVVRWSSSPNFDGPFAIRRVNYSTDDSDGYYHLQAGNTAYIYLRKDGGWTGPLTSGSVTININTDYTCKFDVNGSTLTVYVDTNQICTIGDGTLSAAGDFGLHAQASNRVKWVTLTADDGAAAGGPNLVARKATHLRKSMAA